MATSSILTNVSIKTQKEAEQLVDALEWTAHSSADTSELAEVSDAALLTDKTEIKQIFQKKKIA